MSIFSKVKFWVKKNCTVNFMQIMFSDRLSDMSQKMVVLQNIVLVQTMWILDQQTERKTLVIDSDMKHQHETHHAGEDVYGVWDVTVYSFFFFFVGCARSSKSYAWALSSCGGWGLLSGRGGWASQCRGFSCCGAQAIDSWDMSLNKLQEMVKDREACLLHSRWSQRVGHDRVTEQQQIVEQRLKSCVHAPRGIFPDLRWNLCPLNSQADSSPLNHQESPGVNYWTRKEKKKVKSFSHVWLFATSRTVGWSRLLHPWEFPGKSTGVGCHSLLQLLNVLTHKVLVK